VTGERQKGEKFIVFFFFDVALCSSRRTLVVVALVHQLEQLGVFVNPSRRRNRRQTTTTTTSVADEAPEAKQKGRIRANRLKFGGNVAVRCCSKGLAFGRQHSHRWRVASDLTKTLFSGWNRRRLKSFGVRYEHHFGIVLHIRKMMRRAPLCAIP
jgi:hypothetical protein